MSTVLLTVTKLPAADVSVEGTVARAFGMLAGTALFESMMVIGRRCEEGMIHRGACAFEQSGDGKSM